MESRFDTKNGKFLVYLKITKGKYDEHFFVFYRTEIFIFDILSIKYVLSKSISCLILRLNVFFHCPFDL